MRGIERLPLEGVTVIDCGQVIAGPTAAMHLGDFGAEVIKVENPVGGDQVRFFGKEKDGVSLFSKLLSRNKKSITLNSAIPRARTCCAVSSRRRRRTCSSKASDPARSSAGTSGTTG